MHDTATVAGCIVTGGLQARPAGRLVDKALDYLEAGPANSTSLVHDVIGVASASSPIAERLANALLGSDPRVRLRFDARWELVRQAAGSPKLTECTFAVVDVETTGSSSGKGDRVIEIAIAVLHGGRVKMAIDTLVDPERPIPSFITGVTRITQEMIRGKPCFTEIASDVVGALAGRIFVAHNLRFDWSFVSSEARRALDVTLDGPRLCTVRLAKRLIPGLRSRSLDSVARYLGIEIENRHRAGGDAMATALVLRQMLNLAGERGIDTLRGLEELQGQRKRKKRKKRRALPTPMEEG